jgi:hypothetical protein
MQCLYVRCCCHLYGYATNTAYYTVCSLLLSLLHYIYTHITQSQKGISNGVYEHDDASNTHRSNDVVLDTDADGETSASKDSTAGSKPSTTQVCAPVTVKYVTVKDVAVKPCNCQSSNCRRLQVYNTACYSIIISCTALALLTTKLYTDMMTVLYTLCAVCFVSCIRCYRLTQEAMLLMSLLML